MSINTFILGGPTVVRRTLKANTTSRSLTYKVSYVVGITDKRLPYTLTYITNNLKDNTLVYKASYLSHYDDTVLNYNLTYFINREITEHASSYSLSYTTDMFSNRSLFYTALYIYADTPTLKILINSFKYTTTNLSTKSIPYSFSYESKGFNVDEIRIRYKLKYNTSNVASRVLTYQFKYNAAIFEEVTNYYSLSYSTESPDKIINDTILLKTIDNNYDLLVRLRGTKDKQLDGYFYVLNNLPKYQIVEFTEDEELPYISKVKEPTLLELFDTNSYYNYDQLGVFLIKNVNPNTPISLDGYIVNTGTKATKAKSNFFSLLEEDFDDVDITVNNTIYVKKNINAFAYQYDYLNFTETSMTPTFNPGETCCFSQKILPPNGTNTGGGCSPF